MLITWPRVSVCLLRPLDGRWIKRKQCNLTNRFYDSILYSTQTSVKNLSRSTAFGLKLFCDIYLRCSWQQWRVQRGGGDVSPHLPSRVWRHADIQPMALSSVMPIVIRHFENITSVSRTCKKVIICVKEFFKKFSGKPPEPQFSGGRSSSLSANQKFQDLLLIDRGRGVQWKVKACFHYSCAALRCALR